MTTHISPLAADIVGLCGSVLFIIGFAYANIAKVIDQLLFNALNVAGAVLLLTSLSVHFNLAAVLLELAWGTIALAGVGRALWLRRNTLLAFRGGVGVGPLVETSVSRRAPTPNPSPEGEGLKEAGLDGRGKRARSPSPIASDSGAPRSPSPIASDSGA